MGWPEVRPPSSAYCVHRSLSMSSAAARKRRIAMSPCVTGPNWTGACANADNSPLNRPVPNVAAPAASIPPFKNERRFEPFLTSVPNRFIKLLLFGKDELVLATIDLHGLSEYKESRGFHAWRRPQIGRSTQQNHTFSSVP